MFKSRVNKLKDHKLKLNVNGQTSRPMIVSPCWELILTTVLTSQVVYVIFARKVVNGWG